MPAPTNPTHWKFGHEYSYRGFLYILTPDVVYSARVNQTEFTYPLAEVTYDSGSGTLADVQVGMMICFGGSPGSSSRGWQIIQDAPTETVFKFGWSSEGEFEGEVDLADNTFITVYDFYPVMHKLLRIEPDGTIYKFYNRDFATYGAVTPPVSNSGIYYAGFVNADDEIEVDFVGNHSFTTDPTADGSLTHLWEFIDGTPSTSTSANPTGIVFPVGKRNVRHTVTDSNGKTHTSIVHVAALEQPGGTFAPFTDFDVTQNQITPQGHRMAFLVKDEIPIADYPVGTLVIYFEEEFFGDEYTGSLPGITQAGREHVKFVGFLESSSGGVRGSREGAIRDCTIQCVDFMGKLQAITGREQEIEHKEIPETWTQMAYPNLDRYFHYLLYWHSTILELTDFTWSGFGGFYPFPRLNSDKASLYEQVHSKAKAFQHLFTSDSRGRLYIRADKLHLDYDNEDYNTIATRPESSTGLMDLNDDHFTNFEESDKRPAVGVLSGSAIHASTYTSIPLFCHAPGRAPGIGANETEAGRRLVFHQQELNAQTGHMYKRMNAPDNLWYMDLMQGGDGGFEPGLLDLILVTRNDPYIPQRGKIVNNARFLVVAVDIRHSNNEQQTKFVRLTLERETYGIRATTVLFPDAGQNPNPVPTQPAQPPYPYGGNEEVPYFVINPIFQPPPTYVPVPPNQPTVPAGTVVIWTNNQAWYSKFYRTQNTLAKLAWKEITPGGLQEGELIADFKWEYAGRGGYLIAVPDLETTNFYACDNVLLGDWDTPSEVDGSYSLIRVPEVQNALYLYSPQQADLTWEHHFIFYQDSGDPDPDITYGNSWSLATNRGKFTSGAGYQIDTLDIGFGQSYQVQISKSFVTANLKEMEVKYSFTQGSDSGGAAGPDTRILITNGGVTAADQSKDSTTGTNQTYIWTGSVTADQALTRIRSAFRLSGGAPANPGAVTISEIWLRGTGNNPFSVSPSTNAIVVYSSNRGSSFGTVREVGDSPLWEGGFDTIKIQPGALAAAVDRVGITTSAGGSYSEYAALSDPPICIVVPRYRLGSTSSSNADDEPDFVFGIEDLLEGVSVFAVEGGDPVTATDITPTVESEIGRPNSANAITMPWGSGKRLAAVLNFLSTTRLLTMDNLGTDNTWTDRGEITPPGDGYIRMRKGDKGLKELYFVVEGNLYYSPDFGATILEREKPTEDQIAGIEVYG
jgi:hypothetical protein